MTRSGSCKNENKRKRLKEKNFKDCCLWDFSLEPKSSRKKLAQSIYSTGFTLMLDKLGTTTSTSEPVSG